MLTLIARYSAFILVALFVTGCADDAGQKSATTEHVTPWYRQVAIEQEQAATEKALAQEPEDEFSLAWKRQVISGRSYVDKTTAKRYFLIFLDERLIAVVDSDSGQKIRARALLEVETSADADRMLVDAMDYSTEHNLLNRKYNFAQLSDEAKPQTHVYGEVSMMSGSGLGVGLGAALFYPITYLADHFDKLKRNDDQENANLDWLAKEYIRFVPGMLQSALALDKHALTNTVMRNDKVSVITYQPQTTSSSEKSPPMIGLAFVNNTLVLKELSHGSVYPLVAALKAADLKRAAGFTNN